MADIVSNINRNVDWGNVAQSSDQDDMSGELAPDRGYRDLAPQIWNYNPVPPVHPGAFKLDPQAVQSDPTGD